MQPAQPLIFMSDGEPPLGQSVYNVQPSQLRNARPYQGFVPTLSTVNPTTEQEAEYAAEIDGLRGLLNPRSSPLPWVIGLLVLFLALNYRVRPSKKT